MTTMLRPGVLMTDTEYGIALLDEESGSYWTLNPTAAVIVRTLAGGGDVAAATEALVAVYGVDAATARTDVTDLLDALHTADLVRR